MRKYRRLTRADRCHIEQALSLGKSPNRIANETGFHRSSIYREIKRGTIKRGVTGGKKKGEYSAREAQRRAIDVFRESRQGLDYRGYKIKGWVEDQIILKLNQCWSPEQISHRLKLEHKISISAEAIYKYIFSMQRRGFELHKRLRHSGRRRKRTKRRSRYWELQKHRRRSIDLRPLEAAERLENGHLERDLMLGKRGTGAVLAIVDRRTRQTLLKKLETSESSEANRKTYETIKNSKLKCVSMTNDNGPEFGEFWKLEPMLEAKIYFSHPLCPWERGTVENTIGLLRQYIPKGSDLTQLTDEELKQIEKELDNRPRKGLGFLTPSEFAMGKMRRLIPKKRIEIKPPEYYEQHYF
jgi:IS30 family transposase